MTANTDRKVLPFDNLTVERLVITGLADAYPTQRATLIRDLFVTEDFATLAKTPEVDPSTYDCVDKYRHDRLVDRVWRKSMSLPFNIDLKAAAEESFLDSEEHCRQLNLLRPWRECETFSLVRRRIRNILGPLKGPVFEEILDKCNHGPGTTYDIGSRGAHSIRKYTSALTTTKSLIPFRKSIIGENWFQYVSAGEVVWGSKFTTVPKNFKTDRGICIEPTLNMFFQKGIGAYIRKRLKYHGVDLNDQTINGNRALNAQRLNLATIDLSAASDSVSLELVRDLLPPRWFHLLDLARSPLVRFKGEWLPLEKISSMGNGYTFELESLIFFAIAKAFSDDVTVYGDDIIVPQEHAPDLVSALNRYGFKTNLEKSYLAGNFFESCGVDAFNGVDVTPFYARRPLDLEKCTVDYPGFLANSLRKWAKDDPRYLPLINSLEDMSGSFTVPVYMGDVGVHRDVEWREGMKFRFLTLQPKFRKYMNYGVMLYRLRNSSVTKAYFNEIPLGKQTKYVTKRGRFSNQAAFNA